MGSSGACPLEMPNGECQIKNVRSTPSTPPNRHVTTLSLNVRSESGGGRITAMLIAVIRGDNTPKKKYLVL